MYESYWKRWIEFQKQSTYQPNNLVHSVLQFLQSLLNQGLGYNAINGARSALSLFLPPVDNQTIGNHSLVTRFLKGVSNIKPPQARYDTIWDPSIVLDKINDLGPNSSLNLKLLSLKLVSLLMLTTGHRVQTIHCIQLPYLIFTPTGLLIKIPDLLKTSRLSQNQPTLSFEYYHNNLNLCVITTLKHYLKVTKSIRPSQKLFICFVKPHKPATKDTIARWLKLMLKLAGIDDNFKAHSFRHASTSKAKSIGISVDVIFKNAGWSNNSLMFAKFYNKTIVPSNSSFGSSLLSCHSK